MTTAQTIDRGTTGGVASADPDLWCTYAAVRTLSWLGRTDRVPSPESTLGYLASRRNADGGYAWTRGMASDSWATYYCTQAIADLGGRPAQPDRTVQWLRRTFSGEAYAMMPGQEPDVWATHFSSRTAVQLGDMDSSRARALLAWLSGLQTSEGGLSWSPAHARSGEPDVRACQYGIMAWRAAATAVAAEPPWDVPALTEWIRDQQASEGGFGFSPSAETPCLWATYRATSALRELHAEPRHSAEAVHWIRRLRGASGSFVRWEGYQVEDVWAAFCAVGALRALGAPTEEADVPVQQRIDALACPTGGFTYREPEGAADALTTAAAVLQAPDDPQRRAWQAWLDRCQLPNEGGVMYMPARGAEIRCTAWALAAGALAGPESRQRVAEWLRQLQNPDGGFGYWEGRASDLISTAAAVEIALMLGQPPGELLDPAGLKAFIASCRRIDTDGGVSASNVPGAEPALRPGLQAARVAAALGEPDRAAAGRLLDRHQVRGGGYASTGHRVPDLVSTYEAVATAVRFGLDVDQTGVHAFIDRVSSPDGIAWSPLAPGPGGPLASCLGALLTGWLRYPARPLPILPLS